jgi:predicted transcriptional regulator
MSALDGLVQGERVTRGELKRRTASLRYLRRGIGGALREERVARGVSLRRLAKELGVSAMSLCDFELGRRWSEKIASTARAALERAKESKP